MIGESISTPCPRLTKISYDPNDPVPDIPSFGHPWHVKISVNEGMAHIFACNGMTHIMRGIGFGTSWPLGRFTQSERSLGRFANRCQRYCDRENAKLAKDTQRMIPLAAAIRTFRNNDKSGTPL